MDKQSLLNIKILPNAKNPDFEQRESGIIHTTYSEETAFFSLIEKGDTTAVEKALTKYITDSIVVGHLSENQITQIKYWAVCCVTLGTRAAIRGGIDEMAAFNFADKCIFTLDKMDKADDIISYMSDKVKEITTLVKKYSYKNCPADIKKCLLYIDAHLHETIRLSDLSALTDLSSEYISRSFKKYTGKSAGEYILHKKLEEAKILLKSDCDQKAVAYYLSFCSQSYFINCFKKAYGITPKQYSMTN